MHSDIDFRANYVPGRYSVFKHKLSCSCQRLVVFAYCFIDLRARNMLTEFSLKHTLSCVHRR
jgi:hypothetical protein